MERTSKSVMDDKEKKEAALEALKKMIGSNVLVLMDGGYCADVIGVKDSETLIVASKGIIEEVSIYDIRSL